MKGGGGILGRHFDSASNSNRRFPST